VKNGEKPLANPFVILREEFDDWAVLFNADTGHGFGLNPTGVFLWKLLDGEHSFDDLLESLRRDVMDMPAEAGEHLVAFVAELTEQGMAGYRGGQAQDCTGRLPPCPTSPSDPEPADEKENLAGHFPPNKPLVYAKPCLVSFSNANTAEGAKCNPFGSHSNAGCNTFGNFPATNCRTGNVAPGTCGNGTSP
jgi:SynChlorMet cassette protein ScmD